MEHAYVGLAVFVVDDRVAIIVIVATVVVIICVKNVSYVIFY